MDYVFSNGGRSAPPVTHQTRQENLGDYFIEVPVHRGDCVTRAVCIVTGLQYSEVHEQVSSLTWIDEETGMEHHIGDADDGAACAAYEPYLEELGFVWHRAGLGDPPLPTTGRLIVIQPGHAVAVIDNVVHDIWDCRGRPIEGYWIREEDDWRAA